MSAFEVGDRVRHFMFGIGTVEALGIHEEHGPKVTACFDYDGSTRDLVLKYARLEPVSELDKARMRREQNEMSQTRTRRALPAGLPDETFAEEPADTTHYLGSHWDPFFEGGSRQALRDLPKYVAAAKVQPGYDQHHSEKHHANWSPAFVLAWPNAQEGIQMVLEIAADSNHLESIFPFTNNGVAYTIRLDCIRVWEGCAEAQIEGVIGDACVTFFDTEFVLNRDWYLKGKSYRFVLCGIAYSAKPSEGREWVIPADSKGAKTLRRLEAERTGEPVSIEPLRLSTQGMAAFLQIDDWDVDDYSFHGPVTAVTEMGMLGQPAWRVRVVIMRHLLDDADIELEIVITKRVWTGTEAPHVGDDIEGKLWLQGRLSKVIPQK